MKSSALLSSLALFVPAALCELGGCYLFWLWLREKRTAWFGLAGIGVLCAYGMIQTRQPSDFGRAYAAYGGIFIMSALLWGWRVDGQRPDRYDLLGGLCALLGAAIILYAPRR